MKPLVLETPYPFLKIQKLSWVVAMATVTLLAGPKQDAQAAAIAYINASAGSIDYLIPLGHTVTYLNNPTGLTAGALSGFDAVIAASNSVFNEAVVIGDALKGFADAGVMSSSPNSFSKVCGPCPVVLWVRDILRSRLIPSRVAIKLTA